MKKALICLSAALLMAACGPNRDKEVKAIEQHEQSLSTIDISSDDTEALQMVELYAQFANDFPEDSLAPIFLMRGADLNINLGNTDEAIKMLNTIIEQYPGFEDLGGCFFLKGYAYESAEQYDQAREAYTYFVENYPEHDLAADTRAVLPYLGMTPEDMFDAIMNSANDKNLAQN